MASNTYNSDSFFKEVLCFKKEDVIRIVSQKDEYYYRKYIPKKNGIRILNCIKKDSELYKLQANLKRNLFDNIKKSKYAFGFVKGRSYKDFLLPHLNQGEGKMYYLRLDIEDFFGSISLELLEDTLNKIIHICDEINKPELINIVKEIVTYEGKIPQGAVTSPDISNIIFRNIDERINGYCAKNMISYTRYADDLLFSSKKPIYISKTISHILGSYGFKLNMSKLRKSEDEITLNGFVVGKNIRLSRSKLNEISAVLFLYDKISYENKDVQNDKILKKI